MKIILFLLFLITTGLTFGQSSIAESSEQNIYSKIAILITLALIGTYTYIKWKNEDPRTDP